jgi:hypothetical protein
MAATAAKGEHFFSVSVQFAPQISFVTKLSEIAERVQREINLPHWSSNSQSYDFFTKDNLLHVRIDHRRAVILARSAEIWEDFRDKGLQLLVDVVGDYGLAEAVALEYRRDSLIDLGMTWAEMAALGLDAMFVAPEVLLDGPNDWTITLVRDLEGEQVRLVAAPMTQEMAIAHAKESASVTVLHDPAWSKNLNSLTEAIDSDRLLVQFTATKRKLSKHDLARIATKAEADSLQHIDRVVRKLKNQV